MTAMMNETDYEQAVRVTQKVFEKLGLNINFKISFSNRMTTTAGKAIYKNNEIRLCQKIWDRISTEEKEHTIKHEACHLASVALYGIKDGRGHGNCWKSVMHMVGENSNRCHNYDVVDLRKKSNRVPAKCGCGSVKEIGKVRANRIKRGVSQYSCAKCNTVVELV
jgi:predicted SprT family Zn-dependent metalloprotease